MLAPVGRCSPNRIPGWNKYNKVTQREFVEPVTCPQGAVTNCRLDMSPVIPTVLHYTVAEAAVVHP